MKIFRFYLIISAIFCYMFYGIVYAGPSISDFSGKLDNNETLVIQGEFFGNKSNAAPFRYNNFSDGSLGSRLANFINGGYFTQSSNYPIYSKDKIRYVGAQSIRQQYGAYPGYTESHYGCPIELNTSAAKESSLPQGIKEIYVTGWFNLETGGAASRNVKVLNMGSDPEYGDWQTRIDTYPSNGSGHLYAHIGYNRGSESKYVHDYSANVDNVLKPDGKWHRIESYLKIGDDGYRDVWIDGVKIGEISGEFVSTSNQISYILIGHFFADDNYTPTPWGLRYWDEIYVDITRARVEIGDNKDFLKCTHREIQVLKNWNSDSIEIKINKGSMKSLADKYIFVIDKNGSVSNGFLLSKDPYDFKKEM